MKGGIGVVHNGVASGGTRHQDGCDECPVMLELGVCGGNSLAMWADYFGERVRVVGVDLDASWMSGWSDDRPFEFVHGNYSHPQILEALEGKGPFDLIVDDGGHDMETVTAALDLLFFAPEGGLKPGGLYVILDVGAFFHASDGLSFMKHILDKVMFEGAQLRGERALDSYLKVTTSPYEAWVEAIEFRRNVVVLRKRHGLVKEVRDFYDSLDPEPEITHQPCRSEP